MTDVPADATETGAPEPPMRHGVPVSWSCDQEVLHPGRADYLRVVKALVDEGFHFCSDLAATDYLTHPGRPLPEGVTPERFEVVVNLLNHTGRTRVRVRVQVPESDPVLPTLFDLFPGTEAHEREVFDLFGIGFDGHPDLTRILMPEDWIGHPLRKDYAVGRIPVQFKAVEGR